MSRKTVPAKENTGRSRQPRPAKAPATRSAAAEKAGTRQYSEAGSNFIVGIGASAGGLDALQRFLAELPRDFGFALVFVQHLSIKHKSLLQELLSARLPALVIQQISDGLTVRPGRLYLAPPGREVRLQNGLFQTSVHPEGLIHLPIDEFFSSLAENAGDRSIAVVFSGAGTDGARGVRAVRSAGGTVYVQDPQTAEFDSMPLAAIATGQADAVLSPQDIAVELLKLQGLGQPAVSREYLITQEEYADFFRLLREKTGSRFDHYKKNVVSRRIRRRMYLHGISAVRDYLALVSTGDAEATHLASDLMIGVTSFFRDRVAWKALHLEAVRKLASGNTDLPIRVWTPASSTGEEAYSIAMMLLRELALNGKEREVQVFATDVNERALDRAREGKYPSSISADVPQEYIQKYFTATEDGNFLVINKDLRERVVFARQDLLADPPFSKLDLIICRNLLIYLEADAQEKCIKLFHYALRDGGFLFLGNAETVGRKSGLFRSIGHRQCRIYRKLETMSAARLPVSVPYAAERTAVRTAKTSQVEESRKSTTEIVQVRLLEEFAPASVAIDQNYEIVYHNGPTNRYLRQPRGTPTQNLLELLPENLRTRIRGGIYRSAREERPVAIRTSLAGDDNRKRPVTLRITKAAENLSIVVFQEKTAPSEQEAAETIDSGVIEETAIHQLESELAATRADLQNHIEQLKSLNEELQSSNEELQAANEELETSREELQSLNEELITVNTQLQSKIEEQDATNNDLNNFLASTNIPTIFLDTHFRVRRFTPAMLKLIKLLPSDVGRPIVDMSRENLGAGLLSDSRAVLESLVPARKELGLGDSWYVRTTLPYRTADNRIEGVVITYADVTELKRAEERTRHLASFPQLNPNPVIEVDAAGNVIFANPGTEQVLESLGMDKGEVNAFLPTDLDVILQDLDGNSDASVSREVTVKGRVFSESVHLVPQFHVARIYARDITERKRAEEELRTSEELFRLAVDNMPGALAIYDAERRYKFVNAAGLKRLGKPLKAIVGRRIDEMHGEKARRPFWPSLMRAYETGEPQTVECAVDMPAGRYDLIITFVPMLKDGRVYQVLNLTFDITERKKAEEAQGRLAAIVESADDAIIGKDLNGIIQTWNAGAERIFGYKAEEVIGKPVSVLVPPGHTDEVPGILARIKKGERIRRFETERMRKDSTVVPVSLTFSAIRDASGQVIGASKIAHDVTERKKAEEALRESEERFRRAVEEAPIPVIMHAEDGEVLQISRTWTELTGYSIEEIRTFDEWTANAVYGEGADEVRDHVRRLFSNKKNSKIDFAIQTKTGEIRYWSFSASVPGQLSDGRRFVVGMALDITDRKRAGEALRKLNEELEQRVSQRTRFYAVLAGINNAIVRARDRQSLFDEVCRVVVEAGGFRLAWVGLVDPANREVRPATSFGATAYLEGLRVVAADVPEGRGPTGRSIVEGHHVINLDFEVSENMAPWRLRAREHNIRSSSAFPLRDSGMIIGALTIYSDKPHFFTDEEISLLDALADNISFALEAISAEQERRIMEENLRSSYTEVQDLYNNAPCGYHSLDRDGRILRINDTELGWLGYQRDEVEGKKKITDFYTPEGVRKFQETYPQFVKSGSVATLEFGLRRRDGSIMQVLLSGTAVRDENGEFLVSRSTLFDVTERKAAERRARASSELLGLFARKMTRQEYLDSACKVISEWAGCQNVGIRLEDRPGRLSFVSHVGYDTAFLEEENILSRERDQCICTRVVAGSPRPVDLAFMTPGGSFVSGDTTGCMNAVPPDRSAEYRGTCMRAGYLSLAVIPVRYGDRKVGVLHLADKRENIVSRSDTEFLEQMAGLVGEAVYRFGIEEERMRLATALESAADAVVITEPEQGLIQYVNSAFEQITGYSHDEVEGKTLHVLDSDRHDEPFYQAIREAMLRDGRWQGRLVSRKKDGTQYFEDCTIATVRDQTGAVVNYVSIRRDVTERLRLESVAEAVNSMDSIGYIFAGLRHEIGNPVNSAKSILSVLEQKLDTAPSDRVRDYIRRAIVEVGRVEKLLHLFRTFSLFETPDLATLSTAAVFDDLFRLIEADFSARGIALGREIGPGAEQLQGDQRALQQVLLNIVANAADALVGRPDPRIDISAAVSAGDVLISVRDNGKGLSEEEQRKLFLPFYTSKAKGTGLGLVIVRKLVSRMGGSIEFESRSGEGTTMNIHLQAVPHD